MSDNNINADDEAPRASMDVQSLNNLVTSLRNLTKRVRLFTIHKLVKQSKSLRTKRCSEERMKQNMKKAERMIQEVGAIKGLNIDQVTKFALGNTSTFSALAALSDIEVRAKGRLATHPLMTSKLEEWRKEHEDWKSLAAFIAQKNTGRRIKKKKSKKEQKDLGNKSKLKGEVKEENCPDAQVKNNDKFPRLGDGKSAKEMAQLAKRGSKIAKNDDETNKEISGLIHRQRRDSANNDGITKTSKVGTETGDTKGGEKGSDSDSDEDSNEGSGANMGNDEEVDEDSESDVSDDGSESSESDTHEAPVLARPTYEETKPFVKRKGDMVISKIELGTLSNDVDIPLLSTEGDNLTTGDEGVTKENDAIENSKPKKKKKDGFFLAEGSDSDSAEEEEPSGGRELVRNKDCEPERKISKRKMESTFVTSLGKQSSRLWYSDFNDEEPEEHQNKFRRGDSQSSRGRNNTSRDSWSGRPRDKGSDTKGRQGKGEWENKKTIGKPALEDETLHPSWEARRKKKEQEKNIFGFAGKRTTFDD